jgi:hypothetical protein
MTIDPAVLVALIGTLAAGLGTVAKIVYTDLRKDRDWWRDMAMRSTKTGETAVTILEKRDV